MSARIPRIMILALALFALSSCSSSDDPADPGGGGGTTDTTRPRVTMISPDNGQVEMDTFGTVFVQFSEDMDRTTAAGAITTSHGPGLTLSWASDKDLMITSDGWPEGTNVSVTLGTGLKDKAGNALAEAVTVSYWTYASTLQMFDLSPASGATDVDRGASIDLFFSSTVSSGELETGVTITDDTKAPVAFTVDSLDDYRHRLVPDAPLAANSLITVTLGTGIQSGVGSFAEPYVFSFTTGATLDQTPPTITSITPTSGATLSATTGTTMTIAFSEPMDTFEFGPSEINGQLAWALQFMTSEPTWNPAGDELTVQLPAGLPAGLPLAVTFADYADANGNVQTAPTTWTATVAGTAEPFPVTDGMRWITFGTWADGLLDAKAPQGEGTETVWMEIRSRGTANRWERVEYFDEWMTADYYDILDVTTAGVDLVGFAERDGDGPLTEMFPSSPVRFFEFPLQSGNSWNTDVTFQEGGTTLNVSATGIVVAEGAELVYDDPDDDIIWTDLWVVELEVELVIGSTLVGTDFTTFWIAPGIGVVREMYNEENYEDSRWYQNDRWLQLDY